MEYQGIGKNIEQAIENALFELKASREDVDIKILDEGGLFKKAKVLVSISEDALEKYKSRDEKRKVLEAEETHSAQTCQCDEKCECETEACQCEECHCESVNGEGTSCKTFVEGLLAKANLDAEVSVTEDDEELFVTITGENAQTFVGYRGETLNALQYIVSIFNSKDNRHAKKVRVDINDYRRKREQTLIALANRIARKVEKTNHACKLEPMSANERRIIHTALQNNEFVTTISKGEEPKRYLIVVPKNED